ncbi:MAG: transporter, partial [Bacteroidales bacterium]|nr:transporter [Bacteroidales bacterium]
LAGGPLIIAILVSCFGPRVHLTTYTTLSANMMVREIGISFFLAAVGLGAGKTFVSSLMAGGWWWILYGAIITIIPTLLIALIGRYALKLNFFQICGLLAGGTTNPPVLAFAQNAYSGKYVSLNYATVYPLSMFMRVLTAQVMILISLA